MSDALHVQGWLVKKGEEHVIGDLLARFPETWQKTIKSVLAEHDGFQAEMWP